MKKVFLFLTALLFALGISPTPTPAQSRVPGAPTGVTAARTPAGSTDVRVSWNAVRGATGYRVYWSGNASGDGTMEGEPTTTSFTSTRNDTDSTHYFRVSSVNAAGEGVPSPWVSVGPVTASTPAPTPATAGDSGPTNWTAVANSRFGEDDTIAYGGNRFVAVGDGPRIAYSTDGATWTAVANSPFDYLILSIVYGMNADGNGRFVAGASRGKIAYADW